MVAVKEEKNVLFPGRKTTKSVITLYWWNQAIHAGLE